MCLILYSALAVSQHDKQQHKSQEARAFWQLSTKAKKTTCQITTHLEQGEILADARVGPWFLLPRQAIERLDVRDGITGSKQSQKIRWKILSHLSPRPLCSSCEVSKFNPIRRLCMGESPIVFYLTLCDNTWRKMMRSVSFVDRLELEFSGNHFAHALTIGDVDSDGVCAYLQ